MESLRLAYSENAYRVYKPNTKRHIVKTTETDFLDVAAVGNETHEDSWFWRRARYGFEPCRIVMEESN